MKRFFLLLLGILSINIGLLAGNSSYYFANINTQVVPSGAGSAYAVADNIYDDEYQNYGYTESKGGSVGFKLYQTAYDGYTFLGWSSSNNINDVIVNSNVDTYSRSVNASSTSANSGSMLLNSKEYTYYGFYAKLTCSEVVDFTACDASQVVTVTHQNASTLTVSLKGTDAGKFSVSPSSISSSSSEQGTPVTVTYNPNGPVPSGGHVAQLSIKSSNSKIPELLIDLKGDLCEQQIFWSIGDVLKKDQLVNNVATSSSGLPITLSLKNSSDASYVTIGGDGNSLTATAVSSSVIIVATVAGNSEYKTVSEEREFAITDLATQFIGWEQSFLRLYTQATEQSIELTAATYDVETGDPTNGVISYALSNLSTANVVRIVEQGGKKYLVVNNSGITGSADLTASSPSTSTYYQVSLTLKVIVRKAGECNVYLYNSGSSETTLYSRTGYYDRGWHWNSPSTNTVTITSIDAPYTTLSFKAKGTQEGSIGVLGYLSDDCSGTSALIKSFSFGDKEFQFNNTKWTELTITFPNYNYKSFRIQASSGEDNHSTKQILVKDVVIMQSPYFTTTMPANQPIEIIVNSNNTLSYKVNYSARDGIVVAKGTASGSTTDIAKYVSIVSPAADGAGIHDLEVQCEDFGSKDIVLNINCPILGTCTIPVNVAHGSGTDQATNTMNLIVTVKSGEAFVFDNNAGDGKWETLGNWKMKVGNTRATKLPTDQNPVEIAAAATLSTIRGVYQLTLVSGGSLSIGSAAGLSVGSGGVSGTSASNLILEAGNKDYASTGFIRVYPTSPRPTINATVNMYSISYYNTSGTAADAYWQYVGSPVASSGPVEDLFYQCWLYNWDAGSWKICKNGDTMSPFKGYALTQSGNSNGASFTFAGSLNTADQTINTLSYGSDDYVNFNSLANSYAAPIDVTKFIAEDFVNCKQTLYIYHTGSYNQWSASSLEGTNAGQYSALPIGSTGALSTKQHIIPAMQGFFVETTGSGASLRLNYERLVWNAELNKYPNQPLRAPQSTKVLDPVLIQTQDAIEQLQINERIEITVVGDGREDQLAFLQSDLFTSGYDESYDAEKMFGEDFCPAIFTNEADGQMEVCATNNIVGTYVGFNAPDLGKDTVLTYTMYFYNTLQGAYVLRDLVTNDEVVMKHGNTYTFQVASGDKNDIRFIVREAREDGPATGFDSETNAIDLMQRGKNLYASDALGNQHTLCIYDMQGKLLVNKEFVGALTYDLSILPQGAYFARVEDKTLKIVH